MREIDEGIDALEARGQVVHDEAAASIRETLGTLRVQRQAMTDRLARLRDAGGDALEDLQGGAANAWDELRQGVRDLSAGVSKARSRFR